MEPGYNRTGVEGGPAEDNYGCDEGYSPSPRVKRSCVMSNSSGSVACSLAPFFEGCLPIVNCSGIDSRMVDTCRFDISSCPDIFLPGEVCEVSCRAPFYSGSMTGLATCPEDNTDPARQINVPQDVVCEQACPEPDPVPSGYVKVDGQWQCASGYLGTASADCSVVSIFSSATRTSICEARVVLTGCEPMASCLPPTLSTCIYDTSDCNGVLSGTNCSIRCRSPPYEGLATNGSCPYGNLDPFLVVDFVPPTCELRCPPPAQEDLPDGYNYTGGSYVCQDGWFGSANAECITNSEDCSFGVALTGCGQSSPCVGLNESHAAGSCFFDVTPQACNIEDPTFPQANFGRGPGGRCTVSCRPPCSPQEGMPYYESLICPASNLNAQLPLQGNLPNCSFDCDPLERQGGYSKGADGEWTCAEGFSGEVVPLCWAGEVCEDQMMLTGCLPQQPCVAPVITDNFCFYDVADCEGVPAGGSCFVRCKAPYYLGSIRPATCPGNNTDPLGAAELPVRPVCNWNPAESCPDPATAPAGYFFDDQTGTWNCAPGYAGTAVRRCALRPVNPNSKECTPEAQFSGCAALTPCVEPQTNDCRFNTSLAANLTPGSVGLIYCQVPYDGVPTAAMCPWDNNAPGQEPVYDLPICETACPHAVGQTTPPGFVWDDVAKLWGCLPGYREPAEVNCTTNIACEWKLDFGGCELLESCADLNLSSCVVDTDDCVGLTGGESCTVRCKLPDFVGASTVAQCPEGNIVPEQVLELTMPDCQVTCSDPDPWPVGYRKTSSWECATGYAGVAVKSCVTSSYAEGCITTSVLSGCLPIVPCKAPDARTQPPCYYDTSACGTVDAGSSCLVPCLGPYTGDIGLGTCVVNNTDPHRPLQYAWPECFLDPCPDPAVVPAGYVKQGGNWSCADSFVGSASISCVASPVEPGAGAQCNISSVLSGCVGQVPCPPLPLDACMLDASNCSAGVAAGSSCEVACKYPYDGVPGEAICPLGNTDPYFLPTLQSPQCLVDCSRLQPNLPGYRQKVNDTGYECDEGYAGLVKEDCFLQFDGSDPCGTPALLLNGCRPLADCLAPMVDLCQFDVSDCQLVARGDSCEIGCRDPYGGMSTNASCPMNNTNALQGLQKDLPFCSFPECPDPASLPLGYVLHPNGTYGCDRDYIGAAVRTCSAFPVGGGPRLGNAAAGPQCYSEAIFAGCKVIAEIVPCQPPAVDPCLHDASACTGASLEPGGSCEIACRQPYRGTATIADCPLDNINTTGGFDWAAPQCGLFCPEPTLQEEPAYGRNPEGDSQDSSGWICNPGYAGVAQVFCELLPPAGGARCAVARLRMSGCSRLEPCVPLRATLDFQVRLPAPPPATGWRELTAGEGFEIDVSQCSALQPGEACLVGCRRPFVGDMVVATCPPGNTDRFQAPMLSLPPFCELRCPDPETWPPGYRLSDAGWQCQPDYTGEPLKFCNATPSCNETDFPQLDEEGNCANAVELDISLSGCKKRQPCTAPDLSSCRLESPECPAQLAPGASCETRCRFPFQGLPSVAHCPADNTLMDGQGLEWEPPACSIPECYDPVPPGYQFGLNGWECAAGFYGAAVRSCGTDTNCESEISLSGCLQLQPCRLPMRDRCRYDFTDCLAALDGANCEVKCLAPYQGQAGVAFCPAGNVDPEQELQVVAWPNCVATCPESPPAGYERTDLGWRCALGYDGSAQATCTISELDGSCVSDLQLGGCLSRQPCAPPATQEPCMYDFPSCTQIDAGASCEIRCKHPYRGSSAVATCPANNTDPLKAADVELPDCVVKAPCPDPPEGPPEAYRYTGNILEPVVCAPGYFGQALRQCVAKPLPDSEEGTDCYAEGEFSGCARIEPCRAPEIGATDCELQSNCSEIMEAGSSCNTWCRQPLVGEISAAVCPWNNTQPLKWADWRKPSCSCPDPARVFPGYAAGGNWQCLAGYVGTAQKVCPCGGSESLLMGCHAPVLCGAAGFLDTDRRKNFVGGELKFGPSTLDGRKDEDGVYRYEVFWADDCGNPLGDAILSVPPRTSGGPTNLWPGGCCKTDVYTAMLGPMALPSAARTLLISVLTTSGPAPDGLVVPLVDESYEEASWQAPGCDCAGPSG
ncbi:unnamed protein product [Effrenium voratum]|nr:unnamed protein product [Effrenium voratum]